jgi:hypothetical protein
MTLFLGFLLGINVWSLFFNPYGAMRLLSLFNILMLFTIAGYL